MVTTRLKRFVVLVCAVFGLTLIMVACYTVPETGRHTFVLVDQQTETKLGFDAFQQLKQKEKISNDPTANAMVQRVGKRISAVAELPNAQWEFVVFESAEPNAFCLPGGKVGFYTAILPICQDDAGVATVMGHEVSHAVARHGGRRMTEQMTLQGIGVALNEYMNTKPAEAQQLTSLAFGAGTTLGVVLPFSRADESEADEIGLIYMAKAGYDPNAAVAFWQRFSAYKKGGGPPEFLSTHPVDATRIANLKKLLPKAMKYYQAAKAKGG